MDGAGELSHGVRHEARLTAHLGLAHGAVEFGLRNEGGHGVDDHDVHRAGAHQHVGDVEGLLAVIGLGNEQLVGLHAEPCRIGDVERVFGVDEGRHAAELLAFRDDVQRERRLARRFGAVDFGHAAARHAADAQRQIEAEGTGGNDRHMYMRPVGQLHDRALTILSLNGAEGCLERFAAGIFRGNKRLLRHG